MAVTCKIPVIKLFTNEHNALPCGHVLLKSFNAKYLSFIKPVKGRNIYLFKKGCNICKCPICNIQYTYNVLTFQLNKIIGKIHFKNKNQDFTHYITDKDEVYLYVPNTERGFLNNTWRDILGDVRLSWEIGDIDTYALINLKSDNQFILSHNYQQIPELDYITKSPTNNKKQREITGFRMVEIFELNLLINDL